MDLVDDKPETYYNLCKGYEKAKRYQEGIVICEKGAKAFTKGHLASVGKHFAGKIDEYLKKIPKNNTVDSGGFGFKT